MVSGGMGGQQDFYYTDFKTVSYLSFSKKSHRVLHGTEKGFTCHPFYGTKRSGTLHE
jgi:hypothetical protein